MDLLVKKIDKYATLPKYAHSGDAGMDIQTVSGFSLEPGEQTLVSTGIAVAIPEGFVGLITPRSGLASRAGITVVNAPGVVDSGYRGEVKVALINHGKWPMTFSRGDRVAQMLVVPVETVNIVESENLDETARGEGGFGSTGA